MYSKNTFQKVSVIIPSFNASKTIGECISAVVNSDYPDVEIIMVDDGSTDNTLEVVRSFPQVKVFTQENSGSASAKNLGAQNAIGTYFYFLDSDVVIFDNTISKFVETFQKHDVDMVVGSYSTEPMNKGMVHHYKAVFDYVVHVPKKYRDFIMVNAQLGGGGEMYTSSSFVHLGGFDTVYGGASVEREELQTRFYNAGYRNIGDPRIKVRHYFPNFNELTKKLSSRVYATVKLLDENPTFVLKHSCISPLKAVIAPMFAFLTLAEILPVLFGILPPFVLVASGVVFIISSYDILFESMARKNIAMALGFLGIHLIICCIIFLSGIISVFLIKTGRLIFWRKTKYEFR